MTRPNVSAVGGIGVVVPLRVFLYQNILIRLFKEGWKITATTDNSQDFNTVVHRSVENDVTFQGQPSEFGMNGCMASATVWESHKLLAFTIEGTKESFTCFKAVFDKVISNFIQVLAGKNVDDVATHA